MSEPRDTAATDAVEPPPALIVIGPPARSPNGSTDAGDCADGFCAL